jgi:hypothetical protein
MQPLRLTIPGEYWDSHLYAGRLYLFELTGEIRTIDWDRLIETWGIEPRLRIAFECAFRRSDYLYGDRWSLFFSDGEIRDLVAKKFSDLADKHLELSRADVERFSIRRQKNPFPFPHSDATIYRKNIFVASPSGVHRATCSKANKNPISTRPEKKWDAPVMAVDASYLTLALAAGDEGLFELRLPMRRFEYDVEDSPEPKRTGKRNCVDVGWAFYSIYGSSHVDAGFLASYRRVAERRDPFLSKRVFEDVIPAGNIFHDGGGYSWGNQDKLCQVSGSNVRIISYQPWAKERPGRLTDLGTIDLGTSGDTQTIALSPWKGEVIAGSVALFGTVIECENAMVVVPSEGQTMTFRGEVINWRLFSRSVQYENQLHLIYDDRLDILSFNHDYFVDQRQKLSGIQYFQRPSRRNLPSAEPQTDRRLFE